RRSSRQARSPHRTSPRRPRRRNNGLSSPRKREPNNHRACGVYWMNVLGGLTMRIVVHGQQAFGKAVLEALIKRGENVVAVYVAPEKEGAKADPLKEAAIAAKLPVYQPSSYKDPKVWDEFKALKPDLQVMAFVTLFVPEEFLNIPTHGSIQYHPSLLPAYRGAAAINW